MIFDLEEERLFGAPMLCFAKERLVAYFYPLKLQAVLFRVYTVWIAFADFITFVVDLYYF